MKKNDKKTILSASTSSGDLTIGNYIGAINNWTALQDQYNCYYMVADLHALTTPQEPKALRERGLSFYAQYLACGLDPEKNTLFMQSHVPEHAELAWILNCFCPMGALNRMTQFKEKTAKSEKNLNAGLFTYPVLMAADILLYQADVVPVGEDQKQHLELARDLVDIFHHRFGETFSTPDPYIGKMGARIMSLQDPTSKMSKSDENPKSFLSIIDPPKTLEKKIKSAVTDLGTEVSFDQSEKPGISNLMTIYSVLSGKTYQQIETDFEGKMYGHLKIELAALVIETLKPVQDKYHDLMKNKDYLDGLLRDHSEKARATAKQTLIKVYDKVGLYPRPL
ncbi:MAG: tryptophan--tRNA ligase [Halobacteriovoraceae bacterium]|jgi:tryptophanyl-tRNA synthetase|nr:tryptophan--tRNA ligase [Halobacteriovoraceae bacterium]MBT5096108.1 tryptophan--tRNA ligase [Halobacteriovoraceae bacterium]